ncbi:MAG: DNA-directed RNA polymerase subunit alpha [bacterium]|nr:DNA-directed RNA polymerase subunit alpha [bacterium]
MIPIFSKPKIVSEKGNRAVFEIESLYPGYGITIGNSLRRVLLSSLPGVAVTKMKIKDVAHEFSTIPGVYEDAIQIMLNLKKLRFKMFSEEPQKAVLKVKGEKEVKGRDFSLPSQLELVNKDEKVATLTDKKAELEIEIQVEKGIGYMPREKRKGEKLSVGEVLVDAIFGPVKKVGYLIENMRVGDRTDFDRLRIDIETDGTILPSAALSQAAEILVQHFSSISQGLVVEEISAPVKEKTGKQAAGKKKPASGPKKKTGPVKKAKAKKRKK